MSEMQRDSAHVNDVLASSGPNWPFRVAIVTAGDELQSPALKLFILAMNGRLHHFEFEFIPADIPDPLLSTLDVSGGLDREDVRKIARDFPDRFGGKLLSAMTDYSIKDRRLPDYFIVISMAKFVDGYYNLRTKRISVIALGDWEASMSPPSIIEFIQALIVREALAGVCPSLQGSQHFGTRACICDFNQELADVRLKVITGFLCSQCRNTLDAEVHEGLASEVGMILSKDWIGDLHSSASLASSIEKFGVNLFITAGLVPTWKERILNTLREDGFKEFIKFLYAILLAGFLFYLGWKKG
ncbi:hypothetical protein [Bradyrhizobium commune]|uniref:Uncharacterized protein n=1 Tax=Bradyrhizobium commune TaxID=83627 RepID=A0A7S9D884_9BRAD|nr:hypothetical protein [Bradyrhizobium commune]QPF93008.1 hypothetical protein IC761_06970 [Bradyrhizobium commune]